MRQPPALLGTLPAMILALGVGLVGYYGQQWYEMPKYSEADINASVELNLQLDLQRRGPNLKPDAEGIERMRKMIREEVLADIKKQSDTIHLRFGVGLIALVVGFGHLLSQRMMNKR